MLVRIAAILGFLASTVPGLADPVSVENGGDRFVSEDTLLLTVDGRDDIFAAAATAILGGATTGSLHAMGFDLSLGTETGGNVYAMGATVELEAGVGGDASLMGFTVRTGNDAVVEGNLRLAGNSVIVNGPVRGAMTAMGRSVVINSEITGDVRIAAGSISFGENARIDGRLSYSTEEPIAVPERVVSPDRVSFSEIDLGEEFRDIPGNWPAPEMPMVPGTGAVFGFFVVSLLFFLVLGALALAFMPAQLEAARKSISDTPGRSMVAGIAGFALLIGLIPVAIMTLAGIPFVPVLLLAIVVAWILGYALGAYAIALYVWGALRSDEMPGNAGRLGLLAAAVTIVALLNFIPFLGWVVNFTLVLLGIGALAQPMLARIGSTPEETETA